MLLLKERFLRETRGGETDSLALVQLLLQDSAEIHILLEITSNLASAVRPSGICQPPPVRCSWLGALVHSKGTQDVGITSATFSRWQVDIHVCLRYLVLRQMARRNGTGA